MGKNKGRFRRPVSGLAAALALALALALPSSIPAAEKPADMEEDTWTRLQDNVLEYEELEDRVQSFNPTLQQIVKSINDSYDDIHDNIVDYQEASNDFQWLYEQAVEEGDYMSAAMYQINRKITMNMSSRYLQAEKRKDTAIERNTRQYRKMFTSGCQQLMLAYNKMAVNQATLEKQVELYGALASMSGTQNAIGMNVTVDVLSAQTQLYSAQNSLTALKDQMASVKSSLLLMTGWDYNSDVTIGAVPRTDVSELDAIDLEADKSIAPGYNYTVLSIKNAAPNDMDGDGKYENKDYKARERGVDQARQQLNITLDDLYLTLYEKKAALQASQTAFQAAQLKWDSANRKYQMGMLGRAEYLGEEIAYYASKGAYESADLDLTQAMLNYYWGVHGLGELAQLAEEAG